MLFPARHSLVFHWQFLECEGLASEPEWGARDAECVIVRNCSGAEQSLPHHLKEIWFSPGHSPFSALAVAGHFCTIFFILVEVEGNFSKTILLLFTHPTVLTLSWGWRAIGTDLAVVMIDRHLNPFLAQ